MEETSGEYQPQAELSEPSDLHRLTYVMPVIVLISTGASLGFR